MISLVTIIGGIGMFGLLGVFFGPVLAAVLLSLLEVWPDVGRRYGLLTTNGDSPSRLRRLSVQTIEPKRSSHSKRTATRHSH